MLNFMGIYQQAVWIFIGLLFLILYNVLVLLLVGGILEEQKIKGFTSLLLSFFNTAVCYGFIISKSSSTLLFYLVLFFLLLLEFYIMHKDNLKKVLFVVCSCVVHVMAIRAICTALIAIGTGKTIYEITNNIDTLWSSTAITTFVVDVAIILVLKFIPKVKLKIIAQHDEQLWFTIALLLVNNICMLLNARVYSINQEYSFLNYIQIIISVTVLLGSYIGLFFSFRTSEMLGYKDKNVELELELQKQQQYRESMLTDSISSFEYNLSTNEIISGLDEYLLDFSEENGKRGTYNQVLIVMAQKHVHNDDLISFIEHANPSRMIEEFKKGKNEISMDYRRLLADGGYIWVRAITNLMRDVTTGDIKAFTYIKNIDQEKKAQLELEFKAEKDILTGLYNKAMMAKLISSYIHESGSKREEGTLYMVDIDNFKNINDSLGHVFGDAVLRELSEKLNKVFQTSDIVGRLGGDEFMVFMKGTHHRKAIEEKAMEVCSSFQNTYVGDGRKEHIISGSVGAAIYPLHGDTFEELYKKADIALYISKNKGKNTFSIYEGETFAEYKSDRLDYDEITGSIGFTKFKQMAVDILSRNELKKYIFVRVDINDFKAINGIYGFDEGDKILKNMAKSIRMTIEEDEIFARMSNDNFAVLASYSDEDGIFRQGECFRENFNNLHDSTEHNYTVTFTIGFSMIEKGETDILKIIDRASMAHEAAKANGIGMICYNDSLKDVVLLHKTIENTMHKALNDGAFTVYLQPVYELKSGKIKGAEALVRWLDAQKALIPTSELISLFEKNGFIVQIDLFVFEQVCKIQKAFLDSGINPVIISVNQSKLLVTMRDYLGRLDSIVKKYGISPSLIELELTEDTILSNVSELNKRITDVKEMGFAVSIDNFGRDMSSVNMLNETYADTLKIDKCFLQKMQGDKRGELVLSNIIKLAGELNMKVIAVGVESQEQSDWLLSQECGLAQGFLYGEPMPAGEFEKKCYGHSKNILM